MDKEKERRLAAFETMYRAVKTEYDNIARRMELLKADGKENSATYRQLMGQKLQYKKIIQMYEIYDL